MNTWTFRPAVAVPLLLLSLLLTGCGGNDIRHAETQPTTTDNFYVGVRDVYAHLLQAPGGSWQFTTVTASDVPPDKGFLVRLNDLAPAFDTRTAECDPHTYPANHKCNPTQPFRDKDMGVVDKIISGGIAAGTAGKVTEFSRTYMTAFDEAAFNQAVDEALINTGLRDSRRQFILALERYDVLHRNAAAALKAERDRTLAGYHDIDGLTLDIRPEISGLTQYYSGDIDFRDLVTVAPLKSGAASRSQIERRKLLPCTARACASNVAAAIAALQSEIDNTKSKDAEKLSAQTAEYALRCDKTLHAGYAFRLQCPPKISKAQAESSAVAIKMMIYSRDFAALFPEVGIGDDNLNVSVVNDRLRFTNRTDNYITVVAQTVYYNQQVQTQTTNIDIAPGISVDRPLDEFVNESIRIESSYPQMTPNKAKGATFDFGLAAMYEIAGSDKQTTLYELNRFNVACVIDNRLRKGSCDHKAAKADTEISEIDIG